MSTALRLCTSCVGPVPRAANRCPWCHAERDARPRNPEHLYATFEGQKPGWVAMSPPPAHAQRLAHRD